MAGTKRLVAVSLLVFAVAVAYFLAAGLLSGGGSGTGGSPAVSQTPVRGPTGQATQSRTNVTISAAEVAKHNSGGDCWLIINNKVYNVTSYLGSHPGGRGTITPYCGKEATHAFDTKDIGVSHSQRAVSHLDSLYVGDLGP
ncbi:MAG: cytochrome b5-like heme/steroid binding domain-containing protein [Dehalococcoidia bacterium]|jgi:cytochrome b involved in lipid metabolism